MGGALRIAFIKIVRGKSSHIYSKYIQLADFVMNARKYNIIIYLAYNLYEFFLALNYAM